MEKEVVEDKDGKLLGTITPKTDFLGNEIGGKVLTVSSSMDRIPKSAFVDRELTEVIIPDEIKAIGDDAFKGNPDLKLVKINPRLLANSHKFFPPGAEFHDRLGGIIRITTAKNGSVTKSLEIPARLNKIPDAKPNPKTGKSRGMYQSNQLNKLSFHPDSKLTFIGKNAFRSNKLESVEIPNKVTHIGNHAFHANSLPEIKIPDSVTFIGESAFSGNQLEEVSIGKSVRNIMERAFSNNQLESVKIPTNVNHIGSFAFAENPKLVSVTISPDLLNKTPPNAFPSTVIFTNIDDRSETITRDS